MPKVSEEYSQARRQQIIDAAYRCLARKGFHQATMRDIYEEAGLSPGAVYHYFASKHDVIAASFDFDYERSLDIFEAARDSDDPLGALADLMEFFFHGLKEAAGLGAGRVNVQGWGEALLNPPLRGTVQRVFDSYRGMVSQIIRKAQTLGQVDKTLDALAVSQALLSLYCGFELQLALDPDVDVNRYSAAVRGLLRSASQPA